MRESQSPKFELERALELKMELAAGRMPKQVAAEDEGMSRGSLCVFVSVSVSGLVCVCVLMIVTVQRLGDQGTTGDHEEDEVADNDVASTKTQCEGEEEVQGGVVSACDEDAGVA